MTQPARLPLLCADTVYHVGEMDPALKRAGSYEGAGLSVSVHPSSWRRIARGFVSGPCWRLSKPGAKFLDAHRMTRRQRLEVLEWAVAKGFAVKQPLWRWSYWDSDLDARFEQHFTTLSEARAERDCHDEGRIRRVSGHVSTPLLDTLTLQRSPTASSRLIVELVLPIWAMEVHGIDAIWWQDNYNPLSLSAPRGVLHPASLESWQALRLENDPDEEDDNAEDGDDD